MRMILASLAFLVLFLAIILAVLLFSNEKPRNLEDCASKRYLEHNSNNYTRLDALEECKNFF